MVPVSEVGECPEDGNETRTRSPRLPSKAVRSHTRTSWSTVLARSRLIEYSARIASWIVRSGAGIRRVVSRCGRSSATRGSAELAVFEVSEGRIVCAWFHPGDIADDEAFWVKAKRDERKGPCCRRRSPRCARSPLLSFSACFLAVEQGEYRVRRFRALHGLSGLWTWPGLRRTGCQMWK